MLLRDRRRLPTVRRVRDQLRSEILAGYFRAGPIPSEAGLMKRYGVSRGVIRDVLDLLRAEGLVARLQGAGTFVVGPEYASRGIQVIRALAETPRFDREPLSLLRLSAPPFVSERLELEDSAEVVYWERRVLFDGRPRSTRASWLPGWVGEPLFTLEQELRKQVYHLYENVLGLKIGHAELSVQASIADPAIAPVLGVDVGAPLLMIERLVRDADERPLELSYERLCGDRVSLSTVMRRT